MTLANANRRQYLSLAVLVLAGIFSLVSSASAQTIVRSYSSKTTLQPGMVVALASNSSDKVEPAPGNDPDRIFGVVVDPSQAPVTFQAKTNQRAFVATSGTYPVLISIQFGAIKAGDYLSMSSTSGIAAKATYLHNFVVGQALEAFDGKTKLVVGSGASAIGRIMVDVNPKQNPLRRDQLSIPAPLRRFGATIAGKPVPTLRIYAALLMFLACVATGVIILWAGIRNAIIAVGRNPLSKRSITKGLIQVAGVALLIFIVGTISVYLLLKL